MGVYGWVLVFVVGVGVDAGSYGNNQACLDAEKGVKVTVHVSTASYAVAAAELEKPGQNPGHEVVAARKFKECLNKLKTDAENHVNGILEKKVKDFHFKNGFNIANTGFGHGRYAAEYAALCGVYNLQYAFRNTPKPETPQNWDELTKRLEYLAISLAPNETWCEGAEKEEGEQESGELSVEGAFVRLKITDCHKKVKVVNDAAKAAEVKKGDENWQPTENAATGLVHYHRVPKGEAKEKAFVKVLKLLEKARRSVGEYGKYAEAVERGKWDEIGTILGSVANTSNSNETGETSTKKAPDGVCGTGKFVGGDKKSQAGTNILVDMACLCIPASGTCTACTGTQPIPEWTEWGNISPQIEMLVDGCKARNHYSGITPGTIQQAMENFKGLLNRWKKGEPYELVVAAGGGSAPDNLTLGSPGSEGECTGAENQHCVVYGGKEKKTASTTIPWMQRLTEAKAKLADFYAALRNASAIHHKIDILTEAAIQARDESLLAEDPPPPPTMTPTPLKDLDLIGHMEKHCAKQTLEEACRRAPFCRWEGEPGKCGIGTSVTVPVMSEKQHEEFVETAKKCRKIHQEDDCKNETGCDFREGKCAPVMQGLQAHISLNSSLAHFPSFPILSLLAFF